MAILSHRSRAPFSASAMKGLYDVLSNRELLGTSSDVLNNLTQYNMCNQSFYDGLYEGYDTRWCTFLYCLRISQTLERFSPTSLNVTRCLSTYLCQQTSACFVMDLGLEYAYAIYDYLFNHISYFVYHASVISVEDVFVNRSQEELALGFYTNLTASYVSGILEHSATREDALTTTSKIGLVTCYDHPNAETNFMWRCKPAKLYYVMTT